MAVSSHGKRAGGRLPSGPHRLTSEQVADDQRQRLIDAMVQLAGERGYAATTVADIIKRAEVSRKTFYAHFGERKQLLLAAFDATAPVVFEKVEAAAQRTGGPTRQLEALMLRLCRLARESPGTIALSTIEVAAADPAGSQRRDKLIDDYGQLIDRCLRSDGTHPKMPATLARALAGGTHRTIDAHLREGCANELPALAPQLARWTRGYHPFPPTIEDQTPPAPRWSLTPNGLVGGRAPGTLTLAPKDYRPLSGKRSSSFTQHTNRERILDAVARLSSEHGYTSLTAQSIADRADVSERAFLAHFKDKDDAFTTATELGHMKGQAIIERARIDTPDWPTSVRNAVYALLDFLGSEPYFTRLAFVDAPLAGPAMARRANEHAAAYARLLLDGAPQRRRPPNIALEATVHGLFELAFHYAVQQKAAELPRIAREAAYLVLAPFLGVTEAADTATAA
jgi:AcrR family transcriptional regulator